MAEKHRKQTLMARIASAMLAATAALSLPAGCLPAQKDQANTPAPAINAEAPARDDAYWRGQYTRNRMTPPAQYSLMPAPPRNNDFGEFDEEIYRSLDRQPTLPPLPGDRAGDMAQYGAMMPAGMPPASAAAPQAQTGSRLFATNAPAAPQGAIAGDTHFYPVEQLVYGGDYGELDNPDAYRLMPGDEIGVTVRNHPEFSGTLSLRPDGTVRVPNTPDPVHLRGRTADEAAEELRKSLAVYIKGETVVRVQANRARGGSYFVFGDVRQPGRFPMGLEPVKLSEAVMAANFEANPSRLDRDEELTPSFPTASPKGAFIAPRTADMARVMLITPHRSQPVRTTHDLRQAMLGMTAGDPPVRPGQIIIVPSLDPEKNRSLGLEMAARPGNPLPPPAALLPGQGFSTGNSPERLPEVTPYAAGDNAGRSAPRAASGVEANLAQAYAVQSTEEAMKVDRFPSADEYWGGAFEYADGYEYVYPGEIAGEAIGEEVVVVESVDPVLPMSEAVRADSKTVTISPKRGGWKKGF